MNTEILPCGKMHYFDPQSHTCVPLADVSLDRFIVSTSEQDAVDMTCDAAIAQALHDVGTAVVTHVPSSGGTDIFAHYSRLSSIAPFFSFHEEVAYTVAHGAALAGKRSTSILKAHGIAKAANSLVDSVTLGTTAGCVALLLNDPRGTNSDTAFDMTPFLYGVGMPFMIARAESLYDDVLTCCLWSEFYSLPAALVVDIALLSQKTRVVSRRVRAPIVTYTRDFLHHVLCPHLAAYQNTVLVAKRAQTDWRVLPKPSVPRVPEELPAPWRAAAEEYVPVFHLLQKMRDKMPVICGDTGLSSLFAFPPYSCVDVCSYYGGSIPMAIGFHCAGYTKAWAMTGDYSFIAAGHIGLYEAHARGIPLKVLVMDNGHAMATGGQAPAADVLARMLKAWGAAVHVIDDPTDSATVESALMAAHTSAEMEIIVMRFDS